MFGRILSGLLLCLGSLFLLTGYTDNQKKAEINVMGHNQSEIFHSKTIGDYNISLYYPNSTAPKQGWPVIYLLDGNSFFTDIVAFIEQHDTQIIVVAIDYPDTTRRELDFLPNPPVIIPEILSNGKENVFKNYGGADNFLQFLQTELKPHIEQKFTIDRDRQIIFGHSLGAIFVLHTLFTQPDSFSHYIASSPSIWFNDRYIMQEANDFISHSQNSPLIHPVHLYLSVGALEESLTGKEVFSSETEKQLRAQHLKNRRMVNNVDDLAKLLYAANIHGLTLNYLVYPQQTHQTVGILILEDRLSRLLN